MSYIKLLFLVSLFFINLNALTLTQNEKEWILKNPVVKVGADQNWPPFDFIDEHKKHQGISSEYLKLISQATGLEFEIHADKWSEVMNKIKTQELDILACAANTSQREEYLDFTQSYLEADIVVVSQKSLNIHNFEDIKNYIVALPEGTFVHEQLKSEFPNIKFLFVKSNEEAIKQVSYGKADIYIGNLPVATYYIDKHLLTNLEVKFKSEFNSAKLSIAVLKEKKILHSILQKALLQISEKEKKEITKKWVFNFAEDTEFLEKGVSLSVKEHKWLQKNKKIKILGNGNWHPFSYVNKKGKYIGIVPEIVELVSKKSGITFEYVIEKDMNNFLELIKENKISLIDASSYTKKASGYLDFSSSYVGVDNVIIGNEDNERYINSLEKIINTKRVGVISGTTVSELIKSDYPGIEKLREYEGPQETLQALSSGQIDYCIMDIPSFDSYSKKLGLSNLKIVGASGYSLEFGFGVKKGEDTLLSILNKSLNTISEEEIDKIYRKWIKLEIEERIDYDLVLKVVLGSLVILFGFFFWNRRLKSEVDERKAAQEKLAKSRDFINSIMNSQLDIIVVTDGVELKQVNKAFFDVLKFKDLDEFKKDYKCICDLFDFSTEEFLKPIKDDIRWIDEVLANHTKQHRAKIFVEGKEYIFKVAASYIKNEELKMAVFHDITEIETLHKDLVIAKEKAETAARHKSEFLANMSHEIRTPMNSVIGFTELLDKEITNPVQKDYLNSIKKGGSALLEIINDILDLSKIEAGKLEIKNESINPKNLIMEMESIFHSKIISKNINFIVEIDESIPPFILIDGIRVRQVLFNLIGNAIKFTEQGSVKLKVKNCYKDDIRSKIDLIISVEDTGIGIDKESLDSIFNAFEQTNSVSKYGGTGLGLAICSKLVHMMNGKIEVESKKGYGSIFRVVITNIAVSSIGEKIEVQRLDYSNIKFKKATILVVDDILENRKLVQASLKDFDFKIIMAENGQEAIERLKDIKIDLILMDLRMPIMDGYKATAIIKSDKKFKKTPVIALTASVMGKDLEKVEEFGFDGYLRKPVILDDLIEKISLYLEYEFINNEENKEHKTFEKIDIKDLDKVINRLESDLKSEYDEVKDRGDFLLIEEFSNKLDELGTTYKSDILKEYAISLKNNIEAFDIEKVDFLMNSYEDIVKKLKDVKERI